MIVNYWLLLDQSFMMPFPFPGLIVEICLKKKTKTFQKFRSTSNFGFQWKFSKFFPNMFDLIFQKFLIFSWQTLVLEHRSVSFAILGIRELGRFKFFFFLILMTSNQKGLYNIFKKLSGVGHTLIEVFYHIGVPFCFS